MHTASHLQPRSHHCHHISWKLPRHPKHRNLPLPFPQKPPPRSNTSKLYSEFKLGEVGGDSEDQKELLPLPVVIRRSGKASRYVWDGSTLQLVRFEEEDHDRAVSDEGLRHLFRISRSAIRRLFVPQQVQGNYMGYLKWKFLHRVFSSALQFLATQAMFRAIGFGAARSLPSAAALNWMLKDGLGRLSRCIYTASLGSAFDTNLKRVRFSTSILFSLSIGIELLTPAFPEYFFFIATIANVAKSISLAAYLATGSAINRSFALADNLGEVSAKSQIQTVCFDNLGLMFAALLNVLCKNNERFQAWLPLVIYPIFSAVDLFAIYNGLKHVHLQTLTKDRLEIIIDTWIQSGYVPSPAEVSSKEDIEFIRMKGNKLWPIRIGCINPKDLLSTTSKRTLQFLSGKELYFICMEFPFRFFTRRREHRILLSLRETAGSSDVIMGLLQACYIRKMLILEKHRLNCISKVSNRECLAMADWFKVVEDSKSLAQKDAKILVEGVERCGWAMKNILLTSQEQDATVQHVDLLEIFQERNTTTSRRERLLQER